MLETIRAQLSGETGLSYFQMIIYALTATLIITVAAILEIFKPPHKRRLPDGKHRKMPPGPSGLPLLGNVYDVQKGFVFADFLRRFGEMATVQVGSKTWVVLNSNRMVSEIINRRGAITNGRPDYPVASDLMSLGKRSVLLKVPEWGERRRVTHSVLSGSTIKKYAEYQNLESLQLLAGYVAQPAMWFRHHALYANSVIYRIAFGKRVLPASPQLAAIQEVHESFLRNNPPQNILDCFPQISKLPKVLQWWRKRALRVGRWTEGVYKVYWDPIYREILEGNAPPSFARDVLVGDEARFTGTPDDAMFLAGELIEAGSETTRLSLNIFVMAAISNPDTFKKARAEIDTLCGMEAERLPTFQDEHSLPFVQGFVKELLRWRPLIIWGTEHCLTEDLELDGYNFPKDTNFVINTLSTSQDPESFDSPNDFNPERWLDGHQGDIIRGTTAFGGGRRVCVGYKFAQQSLFINIARLIYCFDFHPRGPINSKELNHHARDEPFPVTPILRSEKHHQLILHEADNADVLRFAQDDIMEKS